jgi:hypothetical protein
MGVIDREVIGKPLALGEPEHLPAGEVRHPPRASALGGQQYVPGPQHAHGHDLLRAARAVMGKRPGMRHGVAAVGRAPDSHRIQQVMAIEAVVTGDIMTQALQMSRHRGAHVTSVPRDQNPHNPMICSRPAAAPTNAA